MGQDPFGFTQLAEVASGRYSDGSFLQDFYDFDELLLSSLVLKCSSAVAGLKCLR